MLKSSLKVLNFWFFSFPSLAEGHVTKASGAEGEMGEAPRKETQRI